MVIMGIVAAIAAPRYAAAVARYRADLAARRDAVAAACELAAALTARSDRDSRVHVNICLHVDQALVAQERIRGGALLRLSAWVPEADVDGVVGSPPVFDGLDLPLEAVGAQLRVRR